MPSDRQGISFPAPCSFTYTSPLLSLLLLPPTFPLPAFPLKQFPTTTMHKTLFCTGITDMQHATTWHCQAITVDKQGIQQKATIAVWCNAMLYNISGVVWMLCVEKFSSWLGHLPWTSYSLYLWWFLLFLYVLIKIPQNHKHDGHIAQAVCVSLYVVWQDLLTCIPTILGWCVFYLHCSGFFYPYPPLTSLQHSQHGMRYARDTPYPPFLHYVFW